MKKLFIILTFFISIINAGSIETMYGKFYILYGEKFIGKKHITIKRYIVSNKEKSITLKVDNFKENYLSKFNGKSVVVTYNSTNFELLTINIIKKAKLAKENSIYAYGEEENVYKKPWTNLLCKFSDVEDEPLTPDEVQGMFRDEYPYLTHYWKQITYNFIDITGTKTVNSWRVLPHEREYYISTNDGVEVANLDKLKNDCTALYKDVYTKGMPVNMFFNKELDGYAWGGWGQTTWIGSDYIDLLGVIAHEMGHGYGWSHSSGEYGNEYDSPWDVMSNACGNEWRTVSIYKCIPPDTIAFHKEQIGAIKSQYIFDNISTDTTDGYTIHLSREEELPTEEGSYLIADIYSKDKTKHYTVEARDKVGGYDDTLPAKAVLIHKLDGNRAYLIDIDNNHDLGDDGAEWKPGEEFVDGNISIKVISESNDGFDVRITAPQAFPDDVKDIVATDDLFDKIKVTWQEAKGAKYYEVYRFKSYDLNSSYVKFKTEDNTTNFYDKPNDYNSYYYRVKACNDNGCSILKYSYYAVGSRAVVYNIQASTNYFDKIAVSWASLKGATYYKIFRDKNGDLTKAKEIYTTKDNSTSFNDNPNDLNGYYYWVKGCNSNGCSLINPNSWGYGQKATVSSIKASGDLFDKVHITWSGFSEAKYYEVYRFKSYDLNSSYVKFKTEDNTTSFDDVPNDYNSYYYRVKACNDNGCSILKDSYYAVGSRKYDKSKFKIASIPTQYIYENSEITIPLNIEGVINKKDVYYSIKNSNEYVVSAEVKNSNLIIKTYSPGEATIKLTAYYQDAQYSISFNVEVKKSLIKIQKGSNVYAYSKDKLDIKGKDYTIELQQNNNKTLICKYETQSNYSTINGTFVQAIVEAENITIDDNSVRVIMDREGRVTILSDYELVIPKNFLDLGVEIEKKSNILNIKVNNFNEIKF